MVFIVTVRGTARIIPGMFHTYPQKNNITMIVTVLIENVFPIKIGSKMLPNNNCMAMASAMNSTVTDIVGRNVTANTHIIAVEIMEPIICIKKVSNLIIDSIEAKLKILNQLKVE